MFERNGSMATTTAKEMSTVDDVNGGGVGTVPTLPLVLARQGSFFVNAQEVEASFARGLEPPAPAHISLKGMYVQYQIPQVQSGTAYPIILVHGGAHTGKTYEETPDGRVGWAEYFV